MRLSMGYQPYEQKGSRFTVFTTYSPREGYEIDADRHNLSDGTVYFWKGTWPHPVFDCNPADLLFIRENV